MTSVRVWGGCCGVVPKNLKFVSISANEGVNDYKWPPVLTPTWGNDLGLNMPLGKYLHILMLSKKIYISYTSVYMCME